MNQTETKTIQNPNSPPLPVRPKKKPTTKRIQPTKPLIGQPQNIQTPLTNDPTSNLKKLEQNFQNAVDMIRAEKEKAKVSFYCFCA